VSSRAPLNAALGALMTNELGMRRNPWHHLDHWSSSRACLCCGGDHQVTEPGIDDHVRGYAALALNLLGIFGIAALLQGFLCLRPVNWLRSASRFVSVLILGLSAFWMLFAAYTGTITSEPWLLVAGFTVLLLGSLWELFPKT
jgi:hypothetical protein